ncbi:MAG: 3-dehydroquinate synthase [Planctomycetota bacterium]
MDLTLDIPLRFPHRVAFTDHAFAPLNPLLADILTPLLTADPASPSKLLIAVDQSVAHAFPELQHDLSTYLQHHQLPTPVAFRTLPGGEAVKSDLTNLESLLADLQRHALCRHSVVLAIGGGAVLDTVGFATAVTHRGLRLVRMPTTTLAQGDSGVGVKNAVNMFGAKNLIGTFTVPHAVLNDRHFLTTLPDHAWRDGLAEVVKVAILKKDPDLFDTVEQRADALARREPCSDSGLWERSAELHLRHIAQGGDPFEMTSARPLDFGHWSAHKLEELSNHTISHGHAVAIGLALDTHLAAELGLLPRSTADRITALLARLGFPLHHPLLHHPDLPQGLEAFRQHLGGQLTLTLPTAIGQPTEIHEVPDAVLQRSLTILQTSNTSASRTQ